MPNAATGSGSAAAPGIRARRNRARGQLHRARGLVDSDDEDRALRGEAYAEYLDEAAKTPGRDVPGLDAWLPALRAAARPAT